MKGVFEMTDDTFNVLLYVDESQYSFSASVYAATLLKHISKMNITVVQFQESIEDEVIASDYNLMDIWPISPNSVWMQQIINEADDEMKKQYQDILTRTNEIFSQRSHCVKHEILVANNNIVDTAEALLDYAEKNFFELIIMGTRGFSEVRGLIFGSFAHTVLNRSPIPVQLIKKLPQEFIDNY